MNILALLTSKSLLSLSLINESLIEAKEIHSFTKYLYIKTHVNLIALLKLFTNHYHEEAIVNYYTHSYFQNIPICVKQTDTSHQQIASPH